MKITFDLPSYPEDMNASVEAREAMMTAMAKIYKRDLSSGKYPSLENSSLFMEDLGYFNARGETIHSVENIFQRGFGTIEELAGLRVAELQLKGNEARLLYKWNQPEADNPNYLFLTVQVLHYDGVIDPWIENRREEQQRRKATTHKIPDVLKSTFSSCGWEES